MDDNDEGKKQNVSPEDELYGQSLDMPDDEYTPPSPHKNKKPLPKFAFVALASLFVVGLGGAAAWFFISGSDESDKPSDTDAQQTQDITQEAGPVADGSDVTTDFEIATQRTTSPRMDIAYPNTWTLVDEGEDVSIISPRFSFTTLAGEEIANGYFKLYFRQGARDVDSSYIGRGVAALPSQPLKYSNPSIGQREETSLQFFGLDTSNNLSFMMIAGNFQLITGDILGPDFGRDGDSYIIAGGYSSDELEDDLQMHSVNTQYFQSTNAYKQAVDIIKSLGLL